MPPFVNLKVDVQWLFSLWPLRDADHCAALIEVIDDPIAVEGLVCQQTAKLEIMHEGCNADGIVSVSRQQVEADEIAQSICYSEDFCCPAAFGFSNRLILRPPLAPCP